MCTRAPKSWRRNVVVEVQLTGIEPVTAAAGALVHLHFFLRAEEMTRELDAFTPGTVTFAAEVHVKLRVALDVDQPLSGLLRLVNPLELERVKPDAAAAAETDIHREAAYGQGFQLVKAGGAFHESKVFCIELSAG